MSHSDTTTQDTAVWWIEVTCCWYVRTYERSKKNAAGPQHRKLQQGFQLEVRRMFPAGILIMLFLKNNLQTARGRAPCLREWEKVVIATLKVKSTRQTSNRL